MNMWLSLILAQELGQKANCLILKKLGADGNCAEEFKLERPLGVVTLVLNVDDDLLDSHYLLNMLIESMIQILIRPKASTLLILKANGTAGDTSLQWQFLRSNITIGPSTSPPLRNENRKSN